MSVPGRKLGEKCPACERGRLEIVTRTVSAGHSTRGVIGLPLSKMIIDRLACENCSASYEAADAGKTPEEIVKTQLEGFKNPKRQPKRCPSCRKSMLTRGQRLHYPLAGPSGAMPIGRTDHLFCQRCLRVSWVFPTEGKTAQMQIDEALEKFKTR